MINLLEINKNTEHAIKKHEEFFLCYIISRINNKQCEKFKTHFPKKTKIHNTDTNTFIVEFIVKNISFILSGNPYQLEQINKRFDLELNQIIETKYSTSSEVVKSEKRKSAIKDLKSILDYDGFFLTLEIFDDYSAYHLANNIGIRSCVYCNRVYTVTHNSKFGNKLMRPQFDHWFPKSKFPLLALSFYNLIPSCVHCNSSVKGKKLMNLDIHIHPYVKNPENDDFAFSYSYRNNTEEYGIEIKQIGVGSKHKKTLEFLKIDEMYDAHQDELDDLLKIKRAYSGEYLENLKSSFPGANLTDNEIYRFAFGTEMDKKDYHKRPFSKFKHDILKELGIIKND